MTVNGVCARCEKPRSETDPPLKKCGGCSVVLYCSKECQKAAWPMHKRLCKKTDESNENQAAFEDLGYSTGASMGHAVKEWFTVNSLALITMVNATVYLEGGVAYNLTHPRAIVMQLVPNEPRANGNPAQAFVPSNMAMADRNKYFFLRSSWDELTAAREARAAREAACSQQSPTFAGIITAAFILGETGAISFTEFPLHRLRRTDDTALDAPTRLMLSDLRTLCCGSIAGGHSYSRPPWHSRPEPFVEKFVKAKKQWKREPVDDSVWNKWAAHMVQRTDMFKSGIPPREIWARYREL